MVFDPIVKIGSGYGVAVGGVIVEEYALDFGAGELCAFYGQAFEMGTRKVGLAKVTTLYATVDESGISEVGTPEADVK